MSELAEIVGEEGDAKHFRVCHEDHFYSLALNSLFAEHLRSIRREMAALGHVA